MSLISSILGTQTHTRLENIIKEFYKNCVCFLNHMSSIAYSYSMSSIASRIPSLRSWITAELLGPNEEVARC